MSVEFANMTYESDTGNFIGKVTKTDSGAKIELRSQLDARSVWEFDSHHASVKDACEVLEEILSNC